MMLPGCECKRGVSCCPEESCDTAEETADSVSDDLVLINVDTGEASCFFVGTDSENVSTDLCLVHYNHTNNCKTENPNDTDGEAVKAYEDLLEPTCCGVLDSGCHLCDSVCCYSCDTTGEEHCTECRDKGSDLALRNKEAVYKTEEETCEENDRNCEPECTLILRYACRTDSTCKNGSTDTNCTDRKVDTARSDYEGNAESEDCVRHEGLTHKEQVALVSKVGVDKREHCKKYQCSKYDNEVLHTG